MEYESSPPKTLREWLYKDEIVISIDCDEKDGLYYAVSSDTEWDEEGHGKTIADAVAILINRIANQLGVKV